MNYLNFKSKTMLMFRKISLDDFLKKIFYTTKNNSKIIIRFHIII